MVGDNGVVFAILVHRPLVLALHHYLTVPPQQLHDLILRPDDMYFQNNQTKQNNHPNILKLKLKDHNLT
jgi:hypothetical protein